MTDSFFPLCNLQETSSALWLTLSNFWIHCLFLSISANAIRGSHHTFPTSFPGFPHAIFVCSLHTFSVLCGRGQPDWCCDSWFDDFLSLLDFAATPFNLSCRMMCIYGSFLILSITFFPHCFCVANEIKVRQKLWREQKTLNSSLIILDFK